LALSVRPVAEVDGDFLDPLYPALDEQLQPDLVTDRIEGASAGHCRSRKGEKPRQWIGSGHQRPGQHVREPRVQPAVQPPRLIRAASTSVAAADREVGLA